MFKPHTASVCPVNTPPTVRESKEREILQTRLILKYHYARLGNGSWFAVLRRVMDAGGKFEKRIPRGDSRDFFSALPTSQMHS